MKAAAARYEHTLKSIANGSVADEDTRERIICIVYCQIHARQGYPCLKLAYQNVG